MIIITLMICITFLKKDNLSELPKSTFLKAHLCVWLSQRHDKSTRTSVTYFPQQMCAEKPEPICVCMCVF